MIAASNFTYGDQGIMVAKLTTDDAEPLHDYSVYLELLDESWVNIGSGLTNQTGHVSILWIPTLPAGEYDIRLRTPMTDSQFYAPPENRLGRLVVNKEITVISIDTSQIRQGLIIARVTDDEGNPVEGMELDFSLNHKPIGATTSDSSGYAEIEVNAEDGQTLHVESSESAFYYGSSLEEIIVIPLDLLPLLVLLSLAFIGATFVAVGRKIVVFRDPARPPPVSPEISKALEEEKESIPERIKEHSEKRRSELEVPERRTIEPESSET
jgi:hypothetical protein